MCMEDYRLARAALFTESQAAVGVASSQIVANTPNCTMIIFSPPAAGTVTLSTINPAVALQGFQLAAGQPPLVISYLTHGAMCTKAWFAIASGATTIQVGQAVMPLQ